MIEYLKRRIAAAEEFAAQGQEQARLVGSTIFGLQNSLKVYVGRAEALADKAIIAKKQAEEDDFRKKVAANPEWEKEYGGAWDTIAATEKKAAPRTKAHDLPTHRQPALHALRARLCNSGGNEEARRRTSARVSRRSTGNAEIPAACRQRRSILSTEKLYMKTALNLAAEKLGKDDEYLKALTQGKAVDELCGLRRRWHQAV